MIQRSRLIMFLTVALLAGLCAQCYALEKHPAESTRIVAEGEAPAKVANARELAIADALRNAVSQAVGMYVHATTIGSNYQTVRNEIVTKASGYAVLDEVESESTHDGILKVRVKATVSAAPLAERLRALGLTRDWKIGVISRTAGGSDRSALEAEITRRLVDAGFRVVDASGHGEPAASSEKASVIGAAQALEADIVVVTDAQVENIDSAMEGGITFYRSRGNAQARAYYGRTGEVIAQAETTTEALDQSRDLSARQCVRKAGARLGEALAQDLLIAPAEQEPSVIIRVANVAKTSTASEIEKTIRLLPGVTRVARQSLSKGVLELSVSVNSEFRDELAERLERSKLGRKLSLRVELWTKTFLQAQLP